MLRRVPSSRWYDMPACIGDERSGSRSGRPRQPQRSDGRTALVAQPTADPRMIQMSSRALPGGSSLAAALHPALGVGDGPFALAPRDATRASTTSDSSAVGSGSVLHHQMIEAFEQPDGGGLVLAYGRFLDDRGHRPQPAMLQSPRTSVSGSGDPPALDGPRPRRRGTSGDLWVEQVWKPTRRLGIAPSHPQLRTLFCPRRGSGPAHGGRPGRTARQVISASHVVDTVVVLGDAERPAQLRRSARGHSVGDLANGVGGHSVTAAPHGPGTRLDRGQVLAKARRRARGEPVLDPTAWMISTRRWCGPARCR